MSFGSANKSPALLAAVAGLALALVGCGRTDSPTADDDATGPAAARQELRHAIPEQPASGQLGGRPFSPDRIELEGNKLAFRQGKEFFADLEVDLFLPGDIDPAKGTKLVVGSGQGLQVGIPSLHVSIREGQNLPETQFVHDGYALTLELGTKQQGKVPGKIYLQLPDSARNHLAGTFEATWQRGQNDPPQPEDVPWIQGTVDLEIPQGRMLSVGYVALAEDGQVLSNSSGTAPQDDGSGWSRSTTHAPRTADLRFEKFVPSFDFVRLPPGRCLVYARLKDGPAAWKWAEVAADSRLHIDLALDPENFGAVEVKVPPDSRMPVRLVPAELAGPMADRQFLNQLSYSLGFEGKPQDGTASIPHVPPGKYLIICEPDSPLHQRELEVTAGQTTVVESTPKKQDE